MTDYESSSMFGTLLGTGIGWAVAGPIGGAVLGSVMGGLFGSFGSRKEQQREQAKLQAAQMKQANLLREKIQADNANLFSSVQSSVAQTSGAMGAIY